MLTVVACVFHILLFKGISLTSLLVSQSVLPTLIVLLSFALSLGACGSRTISSSCLCFSLIKASIFSPNFSIFFVIIEVVLPSFNFIFSLSDLSLGELEVLLHVKCW